MRIVLCLALATLASLPANMARGQTTETPVSAVAFAAAGSYRISPGDVLSIMVPGEELFTRECQVNGAGTISYPLLGDVRAAGETSAGLAQHLQSALRRYLKNPTVTVTIKQYGQVGLSVFVTGEVQKPGIYPLASGGSVLQPIAAAGGLTDFASGVVTVMKGRTGESRQVSLSELPADPALVLDPGDVIEVERKKESRYAVLGEVPNPGMFDFPVKGQARALDAMTQSGLLRSPGSAGSTPPMNALGLVDDPTRAADLEHATISRGQQQLPVNLAALLQGDTSQNLALEAGDVLTVPRKAGIRVAALGEVRMPGRLFLATGATALDLLNAAGGTTATARLVDAAVVRTVNGQPTSTPVDISQLLAGKGAQQNMVLQEGDILYVPARGERNDNLWRALLLVPRLLL